MVALSSPLVLVSALVLLFVFIVSWRYRFMELPPVRATAIVALASLVFVYSLASIPELLADPLHYAVLIAGMCILISAWSRMWRQFRT